MEQTSGQDLHTFFNQWIYNAGHPELGIVWSYDGGKKSVSINITQKQSNLFVFPLQLEIGSKLYTVNIKDKETTTSFPAMVKPLAMIADPNVDLLAEFDVREQ